MCVSTADAENNALCSARILAIGVLFSERRPRRMKRRTMIPWSRTLDTRAEGGTHAVVRVPGLRPAAVLRKHPLREVRPHSGISSRTVPPERARTRGRQRLATARRREAAEPVLWQCRARRVQLAVAGGERECFMCRLRAESNHSQPRHCRTAPALATARGGEASTGLWPAPAAAAAHQSMAGPGAWFGVRLSRWRRP